MYYKIENEKEVEYIKKAQEITMTNYEFDGEKISLECIWSIVEDLVDGYERMKEEKEEEIQKMYEKEKWEGYEYGE